MPMYTTLSRTSSIESDLEPLYSEGGSRSHSRKFRNFLAGIFVATFLVCILVAMIVGVTWFAPKDNLPEVIEDAYLTPMVNTTCGGVRGVYEDDVYVFKGIPYAVPPVGQRRWKPPTSLHSGRRCWSGTYRAVEFGAKCYQTNMLKRQHEGSEDCLFINVWTPELGSHVDLDVVVFIHGGGLLCLSGNEPGYMPTPKLAFSTNTVYVSFNYRLNAFGFLALDVLSWKSESGVSGNYGFMDQILALQWVKENIRGFGGNPNKVTLVGHSSGGTSVFALMGAPKARGLFHRAWIVSGSPVLNATLTTGERDNMLFLNKTRCNFGLKHVAETYRCLYNLPPEDIANAVPWTYLMASHFYDLPVRGEKTPALAIIDGDVLPKSPLEAIKDGSGSDVPLLISNMAQEVDEQPAPEDIEIWMWHDYGMYVRHCLNTFSPNISEVALSMYNHKVNPEYQFTSMVSDIRAICSTDIQATVIARLQQSPVYRLVINAFPSEPVNYNGFLKKYAFHAWDMIAFFGDFKQLLDTPAKKDLRLMRNLQRILFDFIKDGQTRRWKQFPEATGIISNQIESVRRYHGKQCEFWVDQGLTPQYAWIN